MDADKIVMHARKLLSHAGYLPHDFSKTLPTKNSARRCRNFKGYGSTETGVDKGEGFGLSRRSEYSQLGGRYLKHPLGALGF